MSGRGQNATRLADMPKSYGFGSGAGSGNAVSFPSATPATYTVSRSTVSDTPAPTNAGQPNTAPSKAGRCAGCENRSFQEERNVEMAD